MTIGGGIGLIVIGAIFALAINVQADWINFQMIGNILMVAGLIVLIFGIISYARRRSAVQTVRTYDQYGNAQVTERRTDMSGYNEE